MANEDAERKTLLRIDGDAEGAKRAARETREAVRGVDEATEASGKKTQETTVRTAEELDKQTKKAQDGAKGFDDLAAGMGTSEQQANAAREALSRLSPELGALMELGIKGQDVFAFLFSPLGAGAAAAAAAFTGVTLAIKQMREEAERANAEFERNLELNRQIKGQTREATEEIADVLARAGIVGNEPIGKARSVERRLKAQGFREEAIRPVLPFAVTEEGELALSMEEIERLATREEFAPGGLGFEDPRQMRGMLKAQQRRIERQGELSAKQRAAVAARVRREDQAIAHQDRDVMEKRLVETEGLPPEQAEQAIGDVLDVVNKGRITDKLTASSAENRLEFDRRQREAAQRAQRMGLIGPERVRELSEVALPQAATEHLAERDWVGGFVERHPVVGRIPSARIMAEASSWATRRFLSLIRGREGRRGREAETREAEPGALSREDLAAREASERVAEQTWIESRAGYEGGAEGIRPIAPRPEPRPEPATVSRPAAGVGLVPIYRGELSGEELAAREAHEPEQAPAPGLPPSERRSGPDGPREGRLAAPEVPPTRRELGPALEIAPERPTEPELPAEAETAAERPIRPGLPAPRPTIFAPPPAPAPEEPIPMIAGPGPEDRAMLSAGGLGQPATAINIFNHGNIHMGKDTRFKHVSRVENP